MSGAGLPACVLVEIERLDKQRADVLSAVACIENVAAIIERFESMRPDLRMNTASPGAWVDVDVRTMDDVAALRRAFRDAGWRLFSHHEYPDERRQTFVMTHGFIDRMATLNVQFPADEAAGASCRYVQTGTKVVPVYELRCGDAVTP